LDCDPQKLSKLLRECVLSYVKVSSLTNKQKFPIYNEQLFSCKGTIGQLVAYLIRGFAKTNSSFNNADPFLPDNLQSRFYNNLDSNQ
jgi:hypothetical protein